MALWFGVALVAVYFARPESQLEAREIWYGVYTVATDATVADRKSSTGSRIVSTGISPPQPSSDQIPALLGSRFGFGFELLGRPKGEIEQLRYVREWPAPRTGEAAARLRSDIDQSAEVGQRDLFSGYVFDEPEQLTPGLWTLQVWQGDRLLLERRFTVYAP